MTTLPTATDPILSTIRARAYNSDARRIERTGLLLSHDEADELGEEAMGWLRDRLELRVQEADRGVECVSEVASKECARCGGSRYKLGQCTTCGLAAPDGQDDTEAM